MGFFLNKTIKKGKEKMKKIPLFQPFKDFEQGFENLASIIEKIENAETKYRMWIWYGCFVQTFNDEMKLVKPIEVKK